MALTGRTKFAAGLVAGLALSLPAAAYADPSPRTQLVYEQGGSVMAMTPQGKNLHRVTRTPVALALRETQG